MNLIAYKSGNIKVTTKDKAMSNPIIKQEIEQSEFAREFEDSQSVVSFFSAYFYDSPVMHDVMQQLSQAK